MSSFGRNLRTSPLSHLTPKLPRCQSDRSAREGEEQCALSGKVPGEGTARALGPSCQSVLIVTEEAPTDASHLRLGHVTTASMAQMLSPVCRPHRNSGGLKGMKRSNCPNGRSDMRKLIHESNR